MVANWLANHTHTHTHTQSEIPQVHHPSDFKCVFMLTKKCTTRKLLVNFCLGQNEPGITLESSERLLQRGSGGRSIGKILVKGEFNTQVLTLQEVFC